MCDTACIKLAQVTGVIHVCASIQQPFQLNVNTQSSGNPHPHMPKQKQDLNPIAEKHKAHMCECHVVQPMVHSAKLTPISF